MNEEIFLQDSTSHNFECPRSVGRGKWTLNWLTGYIAHPFSMPAYRSGLSASVLSSMVTDTTGTGDESFNDLAKEGGDRAAEELGIEFNVLESQTAADYVRNLIRTRGAGMAVSSAGGIRQSILGSR